MSDDCLVGHMTRWGNVPSDISETSIEFALGHLNIYGFAVWADTVADDHLSEIYFSFTNLSNIKLTIKNTRTKYTLFFLFTTLVLSLPNRSIGSFLRVHKPNHHIESAEYNLCYLKYTKVQIFYENQITFDHQPVSCDPAKLWPCQSNFGITRGLS